MAAWSPRARPGAPVSVPVAWEELADVRPGQFHVRDAAAHPDAWAGYDAVRQRLRADLVAALR